MHVGSTDIRSFLLPRVATLFWSGSGRPLEVKNGRVRLAGYFGCAAAVDRRGYFLTASHCVDDEPVYLVLAKPGQPPRGWRARVVWRGDWKRGESDLALIHVPESLDHVFDWAEMPPQNAPVIAVGLSRSGDSFQGQECLGGNLLGPLERTNDEPTSIIRHNIPIQSGDSGGPLVDTKGHLLGINSEITVPLSHLLFPDSYSIECLAERPGRAWLTNLIEQDAATPRAATPQDAILFQTARRPPEPPRVP